MKMLRLKKLDMKKIYGSNLSVLMCKVISENHLDTVLLSKKTSVLAIDRRYHIAKIITSLLVISNHLQEGNTDANVSECFYKRSVTLLKCHQQN